MIVAGLLLMLAAQAAPSADVADEIVVAGNRLKTWKGRFAVRGVKASCRTTRSTGDRELDALGCEAMTTCLPPLQTRILATDVKDLDAETRRSMKEQVTRDMVACLQDRHDKSVAELVERRYQARQSGVQNAR